MKHPPEPIDYGWMQDNCGNWVAFIKSDALDDLVGELAANDKAFVLAILRRLQSEKPKSNSVGLD